MCVSIYRTVSLSLPPSLACPFLCKLQTHTHQTHNLQSASGAPMANGRWPMAVGPARPPLARERTRFYRPLLNTHNPMEKGALPPPFLVVSRRPWAPLSMYMYCFNVCVCVWCVSVCARNRRQFLNVFPHSPPHWPKAIVSSVRSRRKQTLANWTRGLRRERGSDFSYGKMHIAAPKLNSHCL